MESGQIWGCFNGVACFRLSGNKFQQKVFDRIGWKIQVLGDG